MPSASPLPPVNATDSARNAFIVACVLYQLPTASLVTRSRAQVERFFDGFDLLDPGLVEIQRWRPDESDSLLPGGFYGGVGRKR